MLHYKSSKFANLIFKALKHTATSKQCETPTIDIRWSFRSVQSAVSVSMVIVWPAVPAALVLLAHAAATAWAARCAVCLNCTHLPSPLRIEWHGLHKKGKNKIKKPTWLISIPHLASRLGRPKLLGGLSISNPYQQILSAVCLGNLTLVPSNVPVLIEVYALTFTWDTVVGVVQRMMRVVGCNGRNLWRDSSPPVCHGVSTRTRNHSFI